MNDPATLDDQLLRTYFLSHLDRVYCAKSHLVAQLPELAAAANFRDIKLAIDETGEDVAKQIIRLNEIFVLLDADRSAAVCSGMTALLDEAFVAIHEQGTHEAFRDLSLLFYLQNIESIEMASFQVMQMAAVRFRNAEINHLLKVSYDESKEDRALMLLITAKCLVKK